MCGGRAAADGRTAEGRGGIWGGDLEWGKQPEELMRTAIALLHGMTAAVGGCVPDRMSFELVVQACANACRLPLEVFRVMRWSVESSDAGRGGGGEGGGGRGGGEEGRVAV